MSSSTPSRSWRSWRREERSAGAEPVVLDFSSAYSVMLELQQGRLPRRPRRSRWRANLKSFHAHFVFYYSSLIGTPIGCCGDNVFLAIYTVHHPLLLSPSGGVALGRSLILAHVTDAVGVSAHSGTQGPSHDPSSFINSLTPPQIFLPGVHLSERQP